MTSLTTKTQKRLGGFLLFSFAGAFLNSVSFIFFFEFVCMGSVPPLLLVECAMIGGALIPLLFCIDRKAILQGGRDGVTVRSSRIVFWVMTGWTMIVGFDQFIFRSALYSRLAEYLSIEPGSPLLWFYCSISVIPGLMVLAICLTCYFKTTGINQDVAED